MASPLPPSDTPPSEEEFRLFAPDERRANLHRLSPDQIRRVLAMQSSLTTGFCTALNLFQRQDLSPEVRQTLLQRLRLGNQDFFFSALLRGMVPCEAKRDFLQWFAVRHQDTLQENILLWGGGLRTRILRELLAAEVELPPGLLERLNPCYHELACS